MKVKMSRLLGIQELYERFKEQKMPIKTTYKVSKLFSAIAPELDWYSTQVAEIVNVYAEKNENGIPKLTESGDGVQIAKEHLETVQSKFNELWGVDVELPDIKFTLEELEGMDLSVEDFNKFLPFIEE